MVNSNVYISPDRYSPVTGSPQAERDSKGNRQDVSLGTSDHAHLIQAIGGSDNDD